MSIFERYLTLWVALCMLAGVALGHLVPGLFGAIAALEVARVNLPLWHGTGTAMFALQWLCAAIVLWRLADDKRG